MKWLRWAWTIWWYVSLWFLIGMLWRRPENGKLLAVGAAVIGVVAVSILGSVDGRGTQAANRANPTPAVHHRSANRSRATRTPDVPTPTAAPPTTTPTPRPVQMSTAPPAAGFSRAFWSGARQEGLGWQEVSGVSFTPTDGAQTLPVLRSSYHHFDQALADQARGGTSPFDDIGAEAVNDLTDEVAAVQQMEFDWGNESAVEQDFHQVVAAHNRMLNHESAMRAHGLTS